MAGAEKVTLRGPGRPWLLGAVVTSLSWSTPALPSSHFCHQPARSTASLCQGHPLPSPVGHPEGVRGQCRGRNTPPEPQAVAQAEESQPTTDTPLHSSRQGQQGSHNSALCEVTLRSDRMIVADTQTS